MLWIKGAKDLLSHHLNLLIANRFNGIDIHNGHHRMAFRVGVTQSDAVGTLDARGVYHQINNWHRPKQSFGGVQVCRNIEGIGKIHIAR